MSHKALPSYRQATSPSVYHAHHEAFAEDGIPKTTQAWLERAHAVAKILSTDAATRDIENKSPIAEVSLLKSAGLLKVLGPVAYGGGGEPWATAYKVIRIVASGDGSIGQLLGYHLLWSTTANVVGTPEQADYIQKVIIENNWFCGGAVNPRDSDLKITPNPDGETVSFNGKKNFNTGGVVSDLTVLEGVLDGTDKHIFTFVKTDQDGINFAHNWDALGMRLTESGGVTIDNVVVPWSDCLGWSTETKRPLPEILEIPFASLLLPTIQLVFSNMYLGSTLGALQAATEYTRNFTRAWPYGGDNKEKATEEWYILERYGDFAAHAAAAEALADRVGEEVSKLYADAIAGKSNGITTNGHTNGNGHTEVSASAQGRASISARRRGELAALVAHVKVVTTDTGLRVTSGVFELLGSRAATRKAAYDRFWRDIRTHSLHDPVAYKKREVGEYALLSKVCQTS